VANPITILIEQVGQPAGTPGASRDDLITGAVATATDPANFAGGGTWAWVLVVPNGSSTAGSGETTNTFTFTPDIPGTYLVYLTYDDGTEVLSYVVDAVGQLITDQGGAGVKDTHGHRYVGFGETQQFGVRGWDPAVDAVLRNTSALLTAPVSHASSHLNAGADTLAADVVKTTTGPTDMVVGAVADGEYLKRVGATIVSGNPPGSGTAAALATASDDVEIISALAPTAGQVLKATDPTHATWQTPTGGIGAATEKLINTIRAGDTATNASATPMVVSQFLFNPAEYALTGCTKSLVLRAVAANGGSIAETKVRLYNYSDAEYVGTGLTYTSPTSTMQEETLTLGAGAGEVADADKIYEVHVWAVAPGAGESIELGSAELRLINTID